MRCTSQRPRPSRVLRRGAALRTGQTTHSGAIASRVSRAEHTLVHPTGPQDPFSAMLGACQRAKESRPETKNTSQRRRRRHMSTKATGPGGESEHRTTLGASTLLSIDDELPGIQRMARCQACRPLTAQPGYNRVVQPARPPTARLDTRSHVVELPGADIPSQEDAVHLQEGEEVNTPHAPASPFIQRVYMTVPASINHPTKGASRRSAHSLLNSFVDTGINLLTSDDRPH